ncbi:putative phospholipase B-like 2 [Nematostella vectensis]|uniref:putative phospholipase B-like 2 n=1 Tax=Nematostella vectensis TaxID=45351 RepID=UPI002077193D|nr:putative phospholipase B-like 2 [Nematostella vectensis]
MKLVIILLTFLHVTESSPYQIASVVIGKNDSLSIKAGYIEPNVAWARFRDEINQTGWSYLEVFSNESYSDVLQATAAGMAEGFITADLIHMDYMNKYADYCKNDENFCKKLTEYLRGNEAWRAKMIKNHLNESYWYQVQLIDAQVEGIKKGYHNKSLALPEIPDLAFFFFQASGDLEDLEVALKKENPSRILGSGSCSALVKVLPEHKDIFISHVTWDTYLGMLRIFKMYDFPFTRKGRKDPIIIPGRKQSFSSSPANILSGDDFYMLSSGMVSIETTIGNTNEDLWKYVTPQGTLLEWVRVMIANRLARTSDEWTFLFSKHNSGTYNNQWMVLDYKLFTPGQPIQPGTLSVLEQIPGMTETADMSVYLQENGYWASYNLPYFPTIYNMSGQEASREAYGSWFDYHLNPRAQIFKRDQSKVVDLETMMKLMRYNDYKHDPVSQCNCTPPYSAENAISARSDLNPKDGKYEFPFLGHREHGGTDCKITSFELFQKFQCIAVSGPTHDQQPAFQWSTSEWEKPLGHPDKFDFEPVKVSWDNKD